MTGRIFDIKHFAVHDGDGIRTTVFFKGCPLKCLWCHNPEGLTRPKQLAYYEHKCISCGECATACPAHIISENGHIFDRTKCDGCEQKEVCLCEPLCLGGALKHYGRDVTVTDLMPELLADVDFYKNSGGGVTLSGGECLLQADFCAELLKALKDQGINTAVDTCGCVPRASIEKVLPYTDVFLFDVKAIDGDAHKKCTGVDNALILENLCFLDSVGAKIEIRIPVVPGYNDGELPKIYDFLSRLKNITAVKELKYHNLAGSKYEALGMENTLPKST